MTTLALILAIIYLVIALIYWGNSGKNGEDIIEALFWIVIIFFED